MGRRASGSLQVVLDLLDEDDTLGIGDAVARIRHRLDLSQRFLPGTADGQIDRVHATNGTVTSTPTDIDLAGALVSPAGGGSVTFAEIALIAIVNTGAAALRYGGDPNGVPLTSPSDIGLIRPGGFVILYGGPAGYAVTAGSGDILQLDCATSTTYQLIVAGRSA